METRNITIQDIAETAQVSKSTVSRVINNSTPVNEKKRRAVLAAMEKLNFQPNFFARGLAGGQSMTVGIVTQNIGSPFYDAVTQGLIGGFSDSEYAPLFVDGQWNPDVEQAAINTLLGRHVDGIVVVGGTVHERTLLSLTKQTPVIFAARQIPNLDGQCVFLDNFEAAREATSYLIESGHRDIAHIQGIREHQDAIRRFEGYAAALTDAGIDMNMDLVAEGNFNGQSGVLAVESLLTRGQTFTAIFAANDEMAYGARLALYRRGIRVPEDVSLIGFDDQPNSAFMTPPLTTIRQPAIRLGEAAAQALLSALSGEEFDPPELAAELVIRESVNRIR
ncbi:MAG: LacI family DNA-binding transcriptional regulator [Pirellulaceae bacterium]